MSTRPILFADTMQSPKTPLSSVSVELKLLPINLVSDTDIEVTANQRWASDRPHANPHVIRVVIASQSVQQFVSHGYYI